MAIAVCTMDYFLKTTYLGAILPEAKALVIISSIPRAARIRRLSTADPLTEQFKGRPALVGMMKSRSKKMKLLVMFFSIPWATFSIISWAY